MKIADSSIAMFSSRMYVERYEQTESLRIWTGSDSPDQIPAARDYVVELTGAGGDRQLTGAGGIQPAGETGPDRCIELSEEDKMKIRLIEKLLEALTGKKIKIIVPKVKENYSAEESEKLQDMIKAVTDRPNPVPEQPTAGWGLAYDYHELRYESEQTTFSAAGVIKTADGKEISFTVQLNMSREFLQEQNIRIRAGDAAKVDPLVINYSGQAAELTSTKFSFDLDVDGTADQISFVSAGSGFLALDRNADGVINNGSELFGPGTGDGFAELAGYDEDHNLWIDENDPIFDNLRIWSRDAQGNDSLVALGQRGIGAIFLGHLSTRFAINTGQNESLGEVNGSGISVNENGTVGTVQQIDLTV